MERKKNIYGSLFFLALGVAICIGAWNLGIGKVRVPRAGFMPFLAGATISGLSLLLFLLSLPEPKQKKEAEKTSRKDGLRRVVLTLFALVLPLFLFTSLGFFITLFIFLFLLFKWVEPRPWRPSLLMSFGISLALCLIFQVLLKVPFPKGILGF